MKSCLNHRVLVVEDFTGIGAAVFCCTCKRRFHLYEPEMELNYTPFVHNSPKGPDNDITLLVLDSYLNAKEDSHQR